MRRSLFGLLVANSLVDKADNRLVRQNHLFSFVCKLVVQSQSKAGVRFPFLPELGGLRTCKLHESFLFLSWVRGLCSIGCEVFKDNQDIGLVDE